MKYTSFSPLSSLSFLSGLSHSLPLTFVSHYYHYYYNKNLKVNRNFKTKNFKFLHALCSSVDSETLPSILSVVLKSCDLLRVFLTLHFVKICLPQSKMVPPPSKIK
jgi:hypothetical protein